LTKIINPRGSLKYEFHLYEPQQVARRAQAKSFSPPNSHPSSIHQLYSEMEPPTLNDIYSDLDNASPNGSAYSASNYSPNIFPNSKYCKRCQLYKPKRDFVRNSSRAFLPLEEMQNDTWNDIPSLSFFNECQRCREVRKLSNKVKRKERDEARLQLIDQHTWEEVTVMIDEGFVLSTILKLTADLFNVESSFKL